MVSVERLHHGGIYVSDLEATRAFYVAKDCKGAEKTPNTMVVVQFTSKDTFASGTATIKKAFPNAEVLVPAAEWNTPSAPQSTSTCIPWSTARWRFPVSAHTSSFISGM